jgi:hypothetical protein
MQVLLNKYSVFDIFIIAKIRATTSVNVDNGQFQGWKDKGMDFDLLSQTIHHKGFSYVPPPRILDGTGTKAYDNNGYKTLAELAADAVRVGVKIHYNVVRNHVVIAEKLPHRTLTYKGDLVHCTIDPTSFTVDKMESILYLFERLPININYKDFDKFNKKIEFTQHYTNYTNIPPVILPDDNKIVKLTTLALDNYIQDGRLNINVNDFKLILSDVLSIFRNAK